VEEKDVRIESAPLNQKEEEVKKLEALIFLSHTINLWYLTKIKNLGLYHKKNVDCLRKWLF